MSSRRGLFVLGMTALRVSVILTLFTLFALIVSLIPLSFFRELRRPGFGDEIRSLLGASLRVALIAMIPALPGGLAAALYFSEYASKRGRRGFGTVLEVFAGIPVLVYGLFALVLSSSVFQGRPSFFSAGLALGVFILPRLAVHMRAILESVPNKLRRSAYALGFTPAETILGVVLPSALSGLFSAAVLAFSLALGEVVIVALVADQTLGARLLKAHPPARALGLVLFLMILVLDVLSGWFASGRRMSNERS